MTDRMGDLSFQKSFTGSHPATDLMFSDSCPPSGITIQLNSDRLHNERDNFEEEMPDWDSAMAIPNDRDVFESQFLCEPAELRADMGINEIEDHGAPVLERSCSPQKPENGEVDTQIDVSSIRDPPTRHREFRNIRRMRGDSKMALSKLKNQKSPSSLERTTEDCTIPSLPSSDGDCPFFSFEDRQNVYEKHYSLIKDWQYSTEERASLRYRVENLCREHCMAYCILAQMLLTPDELPGCRDVTPWPDFARQALLVLGVGDHWAIYNLAILVAFADKINLEDHSSRFFDQVVLPFQTEEHAIWSENDCRRKFTLLLRRILLED